MKPEDKFLFCKYNEDGYCSKLNHIISGGYSSLHHCKNCKYFGKEVKYKRIRK